MKHLIIAAAALAATPALAVNLVTNGGFEGGNTGFTSAYTYVGTPGPTAMYPEGTYTVGANANEYHNLWADVPAYRGDNYLIVNGATSPTLLWEQTVTGVTAGTNYFFQAFAANICCNANGPQGAALSTLTFEAVQDGVTTTLSTFTTSATPGQWQGFSNTYTSLSSGAVTLRLINASTAFSGNDFGVDNINFSTVSAIPEPATWAMLIAGFGMVGFAMRRRGVARVAA